MWHAPSPAVMMKRAIEIQLEDIEKNQCVSKSCFPNSWLQVYRECCEKAGRAPNNAILGAMILTLEKYFLPEYRAYEGAKNVLKEVQERGIKKICVTRGDYDIQYYKIQSTLLEGYFDNIEIVPIKNVDTYCQILDKYKLIPDETAMIGDSLKNDIIPALSVGLKAFHLIEDSTLKEWDDPNGLLKVEISHEKNYHPIKSLKEIVDYLDKNSSN
jgi:putative hydrolase of the HAD superfamily